MIRTKMANKLGDIIRILNIRTILRLVYAYKLKNKNQRYTTYKNELNYIFIQKNQN